MENVHRHTYETRSKKLNAKKIDYKYKRGSDSESESESDSDSASDSDSDYDENKELFKVKYKKLLAKFFSSKQIAIRNVSNKRVCKSPYTSDDASICKKKRKTDSLNECNDVIPPDKPNEIQKTRRSGRSLAKNKSDNSKKFSLLLEEKSITNDVKYFEDNLCIEEQEKSLTELEKIITHCNVCKPYRLQLLDADIPIIYKAAAYRKICSLQQMDTGAGEYYKIKRWVDTFMQIPFGKYRNLPVNLKDSGLEECSVFMNNAKKHLDDAVYGMNDAKLQIMQLIGQWIANPSAMGTAIAIKGPMGTGKTTLVKDGISKAIGRDFSLMALGGATDSSFLEGHSYTYEGSMCGKIIDNIIQCKSMNPIFFFDELDKVSDTPKGEEIIGILTHLIDTAQNNKFHDKYFSDMEFDLSRCLFIFSYNDESKINPILRDRMYRVETKGYDVKEKIVIANQYLLPKIREQVCFNEGDILISDDTMKYIIGELTDKEQGIRNLKRCLEIIYTKINLYRLVRKESDLFEKDNIITYSIPLNITREMVDKLIISQKNSSTWSNMYI